MNQCSMAYSVTLYLINGEWKLEVHFTMNNEGEHPVKSHPLAQHAHSPSSALNPLITHGFHRN